MTVDLAKRVVAALLFALLVLPPFAGWIAVRRMRRRPPSPPEPHAPAEPPEPL